MTPETHGFDADADLIGRCRAIVPCDTARISRPGGKLFLIIGFNRRSVGHWTKNGEPFDFDYVEEKCVASGDTDDELIASATEYKRLSGMSILEYLQECVEKRNQEQVA